MLNHGIISTITIDAIQYFQMQKVKIVFKNAQCI